MPTERILFVTGKLAEFPLRGVLDTLGCDREFEYEISVLNISVAALMHAKWVGRKLTLSGEFDRVLLPGWCQGDLETLSQQFGTPFHRGPKDLRDLPEFFGLTRNPKPDLSEYDIEILAEINHAPRMTDAEILQMADDYRAAGANVIDLGCIPGETWSRAGEVTRLLCEQGHRVSIDSFDQTEVERSVERGAELVLSCNSSNLSWMAKLAAEVVAIPDDPRDIGSLDQTIETLREQGTRFRIDPILEPIGVGFADSLERYLTARKKWPDIEIMMGIGNLTELTEVDSAGINMLLAGFCQELNIRSVLTTQVINWCRSAVKELDVARRLVRHAVRQRVIPKHLDSRLVMLRDSKVPARAEGELQHLASQLKDPNFRIFVENDEIHVMNRDGYWRNGNAYLLFDAVVRESKTPDPSHAFYLGYELSKAATAMLLGKQYTQDEELTWGLLGEAPGAIKRQSGAGTGTGAECKADD